MITASGRLAMGYADDIVQRLDTDSDGGNSRILISWPKPGVAEGLHTLYVSLYIICSTNKLTAKC